MDIIRTEKLTKYYGKARGIVDLDLTVKEGEFFGFIGPNGAGKSTTIRTLLGLIAPTAGQAFVLGKSVAAHKEEILKEVGYLPSEAIFYSGMKVKDILRLSADLRKKDCTAAARTLCERLQLDPERKIDNLSFGNRKKVAIVCALQHDPRLLILDEPTSGLDPLMQQEFFRLLQERSRQGVTILLSSHILSEIQHNCTRAAIIREGKIAACGNVEDLARTSMKQVSVTGTIRLDKLKGVHRLHQNDHSLTFLYDGEISALLETLAQGQVTDFTVTDPDLEEIFMHYYEEEGD